MSRRVSLAAKTVAKVRSLLLVAYPSVLDRLALQGVLAELDRALSHSEKKRDNIKRNAAAKGAARAEKNAETATIRAVVFGRANGRCECGCRRQFTDADPGQLDHQRGRIRAKQSIENTWALAASCHRDRTLNRPSASHWWELIRLHARLHGYGAEQTHAETMLDKLGTRQAQAEAGATDV